MLKGNNEKPPVVRPSRSLLADSAEFSAQLAALVVDRSAGKMAHMAPAFTVPTEFDGRKIWKGLVPPIKDQGSCGACWAFAATDCLAMRIAIATSGHHKPDLSPAEMVFCNMGGADEFNMAMEDINQGRPYDYTPPDPKLRSEAREREKAAVAKVGCMGETLIGAWQYLYRFGAAEALCVPYGGRYAGGMDLSKFDNNNPGLPACADIEGDMYDMCPGTTRPIRRHRASNYYYVPGAPAYTARQRERIPWSDEEDVIAGTMAQIGPNYQSGTEENIRREIYHWGPVTTGFTVRPDFMSWDGSGVYAWDGVSSADGADGGHAIIIIGWGTENGVPYWLIRNSWGTEWGKEGGYFKIRRGTNECGIEENVFAGFPNLYGHRLYAEWPLLFRDQDLALRAIWGLNAGGFKATTIEQMLDGRLSADKVDPLASAYDVEWWPDLSTYVAGKPGATVYRIKLARNKKKVIMAAAVTSVVVVLGVAGFLIIKKKK